MRVSGVGSGLWEVLVVAAGGTVGALAVRAVVRRRSIARGGAAAPPRRGRSWVTPEQAAARTASVPGTSAGFDAGSIARCRASVPVEPGLKVARAGRGGQVYGGDDPSHLAYLRRTLDAKAGAMQGEDRRRALAFKALQPREGSTAAINTWDNQIFTWGTGWSGKGGLPSVMDRLTAASPAAVARLAACGVQYLGHGAWRVDDGEGHAVTGVGPALQTFKDTPALLFLFIDLAKNPETRDAVTDAQLGTFLATSGRVSGSEAIATQALFTFVTHLAHWAPGYVAPPRGRSVVEVASGEVPGPPSEARDRALAPAIVRAFYANAPAGSYVRSGWKQVQQYVRQMRDDGLDVVADPTLASSAPPGDLVA